MCGVDVDPLLGFCVDQTEEDAAAWEYQHVHPTGSVEDSQFKITVEGAVAIGCHSIKIKCSGMKRRL